MDLVIVLGIVLGFVLWDCFMIPYRLRRANSVVAWIGSVLVRIDMWWFSRYIARLSAKPHDVWKIRLGEFERSLEDQLYFAAGGCGCLGCLEYVDPTPPKYNDEVRYLNDGERIVRNRETDWGPRPIYASNPVDTGSEIEVRYQSQGKSIIETIHAR